MIKNNEKKGLTSIPLKLQQMLRSHRTGEENTDAKGKRGEKKSSIHEAETVAHRLEVRFIDASVALGLRETVEPSERARGREEEKR